MNPGAVGVEGEPLLTRRRLLGGFLAAGAGAVLTSCSGSGSVPAAATTSLGSAARTAKLSSIDHVVFVIQENRSFDHYFGALRGVRGFDDRSGTGPGAFEQTWAPNTSVAPVGRILPFHLDTANTNAACTNDITHSWAAQHRSWAGGRMDGWGQAHLTEDGAADGAVAMGYYTRQDLAYYYALADSFTICDNHHCSVMGPTDPNRLYSLSATIDPAGTNGGPVIKTNGPADTKALMFSKRWTTMPEQLQARGVSWKVYQAKGSTISLLVSNNSLMYFEKFADPKGDLHHLAFDPIYPDDFLADVASGNLPQVSWVLAPLGHDEHPPASPNVGAWFASNVVAALTANPAVWSKTVMFLTYDENGGFFDHVVPPTPPPGTSGEYVTASSLPADMGGVAGPIGLGFRVPMIVASPFSRGGYVSSETTDHTSMLRFLETRFGVEVPNLSAWRRGVTGDLTSALELSAPDPSVPALPATAQADDVVRRECPVNEIVAPVPPYPFPKTQAMPAQEPGAAKRRTR